MAKKAGLLVIALCGGALIDNVAADSTASRGPQHHGSHRKHQGKQKQQGKSHRRQHSQSHIHRNHELRRSRIPAVDGEPLIDVLPEGDDSPIDILLEEDDGHGEPLMDVLPKED